VQLKTVRRSVSYVPLQDSGHFNSCALRSVRYVSPELRGNYSKKVVECEQLAVEGGIGEEAERGT
jgi:hypothetical protein